MTAKGGETSAAVTVVRGRQPGDGNYPGDNHGYVNDGDSVHSNHSNDLPGGSTAQHHYKNPTNNTPNDVSDGGLPPASHVIYVTSQAPWESPFTDLAAPPDSGLTSRAPVYPDLSPTFPGDSIGSSEIDSTIDSYSDSEAADDSKQFCWGLCCVQGCIWGVIGGIYFLVVLPCGFLLILYGSNKSLTWPMVAGSVLLALATCVFPALCVCVRWWRRRQRDRSDEYRVQRDKAATRESYVNPLAT